jgi:hypothetical protein
MTVRLAVRAAYRGNSWTFAGYTKNYNTLIGTELAWLLYCMNTASPTPGMSQAVRLQP